MAPLDRYVYAAGKKLRCGWTTGSCATAAAKAAVLHLLGQPVDEVEIDTPKGIRLKLPVEQCVKTPDGISCGIKKDGGDDVDATHGMVICAQVTLSEDTEILIDGGAGVGRVTRVGLEQPVGAAAINRVPREMIAREVRETLDAFGDRRGAKIIICALGGEKIAQKTFNPRLGIEGGISILGTTGIVEPMSESALIESIRMELEIMRAQSDAPIILTPGNYAQAFASKQLGLQLRRSVLCSNFFGETFDHLERLAFSSVLLVGHIGKLVKLAGGIYQTHSRVADARMEILAAHTALAGADHQTVQAVFEALTTDAALDQLQAVGLLKPVVASLLSRMEFYVKRRLGEIPFGILLFSDRHGLLGQTEHSKQILEQIRQSEEQV